MIRYLAVLASLITLTGGGAIADPTVPAILSPSQMHWKPGTGPLKGTQVVQLLGDPSKPGAFVTRIRFPDGHKVAPHYHAVMENVTVLQGTLLLGVGSKADMSKVAQGDTIIQLNDVGPWSMHPVNHP